MNRWIRIGMLVTVLALSAGLAQAAGVSVKQKKQINDLLDSAISSYEIPGISYAVKKFGESAVTGARGVKDWNTLEPLTASDRMRIGSASKTFISMGVMKLVSQGIINIDDPLIHVLPESTNLLSFYDTTNITVRMLINHTAGIANYTDIDEWAFGYILDRTAIWSNTQLVAFVNSYYTNGYSAYCTPGQKWHYSNTHYVLLGLILERFSGTDIATFVEDTFIEPLKLSNTFYPRPGESTVPAPYATGYMNWSNYFGLGFLPDTTMDVTVYDPSGVGPAGAMISTPRDLATWMEAIVTDKIGLGASYNPDIYNWKLFQQWLSPAYVVTNSNWPYALGYGLGLAHEADQENMANYFIVGHRGQLSGYDTGMMVLPQKKTAIVVMCNRSLKNDDGYPSNALEAGLNGIVAILFPDYVASNPIATGPVYNVGKKGLSGKTGTGSYEGNLSQAALSEYR